MATFAISLTAVVEADSYQQAYAIQKQIFEKLSEDFEEVTDVGEIDVEHTDGDLADEDKQ